MAKKKQTPNVEPPEHLREGYVPEGMVTCTSCGMELPQTAKYFDRDNSKDSGFRNVCKQCRAEKKKREENAEVIAAAKKLDDHAVKFLKLAGEDKTNGVPHMASLCEEVLAVFGGTKGYARHLMSTYLNAEAGGMIRQKILSAAQQLVVKTTEGGYAQVPLDQMTEDDLQSSIAEMEERLVEQARQKLILYPESRNVSDESEPGRSEAG